MAESEEEVDVLVQRVVKDITNAFKRNPNIDEVGVIPCPEARCNRSPIVLVENKLGVESWCIKFLLPCVHNKLLLYRQRHHWLDREALVDITCTLLLLNPDFTTAWNVRKELVQCGVLNPEKDLYLGQLALTRSPKSPETWIHRRWVLQHILHQSSAPPPPQPDAAGRSQELITSPQPTATGWSQELNPHLCQTLHQEIKVCADAASRYPSNYNAWSHRIWVLQHMAKGNVKLFHDELSSMSRWVSRHVSDHSGFHYRQFLLQELITELCPPQKHDSPPEQLGSSPQEYADPPQELGCPPQQHDGPHTNGELSGVEATAEEERQLGLFSVFQLFHQEMVLCSDLIQSFPGHETLWSHRRHVFYLWHQWRTERHCRSRGDMDSDGAALQDALPAREHHCSSRGDMDSDGAALQDARLAREPVEGPRWGIEPMEVDRASMSDPQDSKRLKRGVALPSLPSERGFVSGVLRSCCCHEQRRFAAAYRKWLDTVVHPTPALSQHSSCL